MSRTWLAPSGSSANAKLQVMVLSMRVDDAIRVDTALTVLGLDRLGRLNLLAGSGQEDLQAKYMLIKDAFRKPFDGIGSLSH